MTKNLKIKRDRRRARGRPDRHRGQQAAAREEAQRRGDKPRLQIISAAEIFLDRLPTREQSRIFAIANNEPDADAGCPLAGERSPHGQQG
jgi:hypothetical protein